MAADDDRTPIDDLVDLFLYAPVGLLYEYEEVIPKLVRRGKSQVQLARVLGTMAVKGQGPVPANMMVEAVASMVVSRLGEIGESLGLTPQQAEEAPGSTTETKPADASTGATAAPDGERAAVSRDAGDRVETETEIDVDDVPLPIASYDTLTAREIIGLLDELDAGQLARIRAHEENNRARKTVLGKLDRLSA